MDNEKRTLTVNTFDDLINMNGEVYETQRLSAEISKDGRTLTVNTFKDLKHFLDRVLYKHFQITVDKPIKELIIKDSKTDWTVNYVKELLRNAALQTVENFEIISPDSRFCTIDGLLYSGSGECA